MRNIPSFLATGPFLALGLAAMPAGPAAAQEIAPLGEARLRYENVDQDGFTQNGEGLTLRVRTGVQVSDGPFSALVEGQGNLAIVDRYDDGLSGPSDRPLIADPENLGIYRAQIQVALPALTLTAGRQLIAMQDERFVGRGAFRQNGRTFDAVRAQAEPVEGVKADIVYAWSERTIWGRNGTGARQQAVGGDKIFTNLSAATPLGELTGFGYWIDQDEVEVQGFGLSSKTLGLRLAGQQALGGNTAVAWQGSYAHQSDYGRNPQDYSADYWMADLGVDFGAPDIGVGYEVLGADDGRALTSFRTPVAANFKFQGWADRFTATPPDGVRDLYARARWNGPAVGPAKSVLLQAVWHRFESDRANRHYGNEINLLAGASFGDVNATVRFADYRADTFSVDTQKFWLQLDWTI